MHLYSQRDPAYGSRRLGESKLTVHAYGCFLVSIATIYQRDPKELLDVKGAFTNDGLLVSQVLAKHCGGQTRTVSKPPDGWCIAITDHYKGAGYPTHFFCYNHNTKEQIDPLDFPAKVEPVTYNIIQYREFTNIELDTSTPVPTPVFPDVPVDDPDAEDIEYAKNQGLVKGYPDGLFRPERTVTRRELAIVAARLRRLDL